MNFNFFEQLNQLTLSQSSRPMEINTTGVLRLLIPWNLAAIWKISFRCSTAISPAEIVCGFTAVSTFYITDKIKVLSAIFYHDKGMLEVIAMINDKRIKITLDYLSFVKINYETTKTSNDLEIKFTVVIRQTPGYFIGDSGSIYGGETRFVRLTNQNQDETWNTLIKANAFQMSFKLPVSTLLCC